MCVCVCVRQLLGEKNLALKHPFIRRSTETATGETGSGGK